MLAYPPLRSGAPELISLASMNQFVIQVIASCIGGIVATLVMVPFGRWINERYRRYQPTSSTGMKRTYFGRSSTFLAASILLLSCCVFLGIVPCIAIFILVAELVLGEGKVPLDINLIAPPLALIGVLFGASYALLSSRLKCEQCSRGLFSQEIEVMPHMMKYAGFSGFVAVAMSGLFDKKFQCMHCGRKYKIYGKDQVKGS